jgi:hypothetical protein
MTKGRLAYRQDQTPGEWANPPRQCSAPTTHQPPRFREENLELLRVVRGQEAFGRENRTDADLKTEKQAFADNAGM